MVTAEGLEEQFDWSPFASVRREVMEVAFVERWILACEYVSSVIRFKTAL